MRLICPNCDAQYEVAEDAVPEAGRDVQCSNCGHAWFQSPEGSDADGTAPSDAPLDPVEAATYAEDGDDGPDEDTDAPAFDQPPPLKPREIDASVLAVLREEAERETAARRRDAEAAVAEGKARAELSAQADPVAVPAMPLDLQPVASPEPMPSETQILVPLRDNVEDDPFADPAVVAARPAKRRELLPDIDAIRSTLQAGTDRSDPDADLMAEPYEPARRSAGFRAGFLLTVAVGIVLALVYVTAPGIAARFPVMQPTLGAYVAGVDDARLWLDGMARRASDSLTAQGLGGATAN